MDLTLIVSTYNNSASLIRTLNSVARQNLGSACWECVVVNNNSTDDTSLRVNTFIAEHSNLNIRLIEESRQGLSFARNRGVAEAQGDIVVFIDDDETINEGFLSAYLDLFRNHDTFAAAGAVKVRYDSKRPKWMSHFTEKMIANPINLGRNIIAIATDITPAGGNMAFNREVFNIYGGFDTQLGRKGEQLLGGEENDLFERLRSLGERVYYAPNAIVYHHIADKKLTAESFDRLAYGVGVSKYLRAEKYGTENELYSDEKRKRLITVVLCILYTLILCPSKAKWLWRIRKGISKGIFDSTPTED